MNQQQKNYFIKRVDEIKGEKLSTMLISFPEIEWKQERKDAFHNKIVSLVTRDRLIELIEIQLDGYYYSHQTDPKCNWGTISVFDILEGREEWTEMMNNKVQKFEQDKNALRMAIIEGANKAKDIIMFGSESEALEVLAEFENTNY
jgi:hypothetical protein|tara:strand:+ start:2085 stop:2522 length:438 start_codon:yes stop_codon:yes gene_type:complete